jgi:hypothetical protein
VKKHNSGCTDIEKVPMFDGLKMPYLLMRSRFSLDIVDTTGHRLYPLVFDQMNAQGLTRKMASRMISTGDGLALEVYMVCDAQAKEPIR